MRPSQPEPDRLYMNVNKQQHYQEALRVSDEPTSSNHHVRMPSESSILDEPIDVLQVDEENGDEDGEFDEDPQNNSNFYVDNRPYENFPTNYGRYQNNDETLTMENLENDVINSSMSTVDIRYQCCSTILYSLVRKGSVLFLIIAKFTLCGNFPNIQLS